MQYVQYFLSVRMMPLTDIKQKFDMTYVLVFSHNCMQSQGEQPFGTDYRKWKCESEPLKTTFFKAKI